MDKRAVLAACQHYRLQMGRGLSGRPAGHRQGEGTGASVEFTEFRPYIAGDDPRSMGLADGYKATVAAELAIFFMESGRREGFASCCFLAGEQLQTLQPEQAIEFNSDSN